jgi:hypothetical protein
MTQTSFLVFLVFVAAAVGLMISRYLPNRQGRLGLAGLFTWLVYVGMLSYLGVVRNPNVRPPGIFLIVLPVLLFVAIALVRSSFGARMALAFPLWLLLCFQAFRVGVELLLHRLWMDGLVPRLMTYEGGNVDILAGLSAPLIAWIAMRARSGTQLVMIWNYFGLATLANIVVRSALTAPGPLNAIHSEVPNLAIGLFPFTFIAGFFAPLAVILHVLAIRALRARLQEVPVNQVPIAAAKNF